MSYGHLRSGPFSGSPPDHPLGIPVTFLRRTGSPGGVLPVDRGVSCFSGLPCLTRVDNLRKGTALLLDTPPGYGGCQYMPIKDGSSEGVDPVISRDCRATARGSVVLPGGMGPPSVLQSGELWISVSVSICLYWRDIPAGPYCFQHERCIVIHR